EANRLSTSLIRMALGVITNKIDYIRPPEDPTPELMALKENPAFERMFRYAFIGSPDTVREKIEDFLQETGVDEIMVVSHFYDHEQRLRSYEYFAGIMKELTKPVKDFTDSRRLD